VAVNVEKLPEGTVVFEDIGTEKKRGKILKTLKLPQNTRQGDPLAGRIVYETLEGYGFLSYYKNYVDLVYMMLILFHYFLIVFGSNLLLCCYS